MLATVSTARIVAVLTLLLGLLAESLASKVRHVDCWLGWWLGVKLCVVEELMGTVVMEKRRKWASKVCYILTMESHFPR
jgi:hypothetical protein